MNASNSDDQQSIIVHATPDVVDNQEKNLVTVSRICSALSTAPIVYRVIFILNGSTGRS